MSEGTTSAQRLLRVIKRRDPQTRPVEVKELDERDSAFSLLHDFGVTGFADTQPSQPMALEPTEFDQVMRRLGRHA